MTTASQTHSQTGNTSPLLVVFDIDGTLTVSVSVHQWALLQAFEAWGLRDINTDWGSYPHFSDSSIFQENVKRQYGRRATEEEMAQLEAHFERAYFEALGDGGVEALPGAAACLAELTARGIPFCFATGSLRSAAENKLACFPGVNTHPVLATASEAETRADIVGLAVERAKQHHGVTSFDRIVSIGDGLWDYRTAEALGYEFLGIGAGESAEKLRAAGAARVIPDFADEKWLEIVLHLA